ncbi:hypothetical protein [Streptomyces sp. NPDC058252]|uniref:hypothetical protein n=1 Tax=Streptomyces sp. NPDC058252 TaxID=3346405 RepID=UPI0036E72092
MAARTSRAQKPKTGEAYVLDNAEGHGAGLGHIPNGSLVTVVDVHPAGTPGVGHAGDDAVLLAHEHETHVITDDGSHAPGVALRHFTVRLVDFSRLFKKVED